MDVFPEEGDVEDDVCDVEPDVKDQCVDHQGNDEFLDGEVMTSVVAEKGGERLDFPHVPGCEEDDPDQSLNAVDDLLPIASLPLLSLGNVIGELQSSANAEKYN